MLDHLAHVSIMWGVGNLEVVVFLRWAARMGASTAWGDVVLLHAVVCAFSVDLIALIDGQEKLFGQSVMENARDDAQPLAFNLVRE